MRSHRMLETVLPITRHLLVGAIFLTAALFAGPSFADDHARPVKVMIINMFGGTFSEASAFTGNLGLTQSIPVRGLSPDYPNILCNSDDVCQMIAGEGHANVATSTGASRKPSVSTKPGGTVFTVMPLVAYSSANALVSPMTPPLAAA